MRKDWTEPDDYLPELIPEYKEQKLTYNLHWKDPMPQPGQYLVSIGRKTMAVGTIYQIVTCRRIFQKKGRDYVRRYGLVVIKVPEMRTHLVHDPSAGTVTIKGKPAHPMYWFPRSKKPSL